MHGSKIFQHYLFNILVTFEIIYNRIILLQEESL